LQRSDYEDCLIVLYFGRGEPLSLCLRRAYRDFQRTLHGISKRNDFAKAEKARGGADEALTQMITAIRGMDRVTQAKFDNWHREGCQRLAAIYRKSGYSSFHVGQAQKWFNMTFKYIFVMGEQRIPGFGHLYDLCHVPLDTILMDALRPYGFEPLPSAWSKLNDYDLYLERQHWIRSRFPLSPLDVEFCLWLGRPLPTQVPRANADPASVPAMGKA
jgi:hypothetical protein